MSVLLLFFKHSISIGATLAFIPLMVAVYFLQARINSGGLLIKLSFMLAGLFALYLLFKIIIKFIHREESEHEIDTKHLITSSLFSGMMGKNILQGVGLIVGVLFLAFLPAPWNILLILVAFYFMFTVLMNLA